MKVSSNIVATEAELKKLGIDLEKLQEDLTLPNPEYQNRMRFGKGRFYKKIDPTICYLRKVGDEYIVPRYYIGEIGKYGNEGRDIDLEFKFKLRDYQQEFWDANSHCLDESTGILLEAACGSGKCHGKGTKILMYDGSVKNVEDIVVGDLLMGDDSTPRKVLSLAHGMEELYKVHQVKGEDYVVNKSHILSLQYRPWGSKSGISNRNRFAHEHYGQVIDIPLMDYMESSKTRKSYLYGYCVAVDYPKKSVSVNPYFLGLWLGDGIQKGTQLCLNSRDRVLVRYCKDYAESLGLRFEMYQQKDNKSNIYSLRGIERDSTGHVDNPLLCELRKYNLIDNKHIPKDYLVNCKETRYALLAGLLDTDGYYHCGYYEITQKRKGLAEDIRRLCWSLGLRVRMTEKIVNGTSYWRLSISGEISKIPCLLLRKKASERKINKDPYVTGISVESIGEGDYYGFTLDGNHRYCLWDGTVTHNTILGIYIAVVRGKQTMVLVPTYYLAKQWKQRIEEATNGSCVILTAKDTEIPVDADFTVVVTDLFTCRELPKALCDNIGLVILDEAHRMGAETYLPILDEIPAKYRLALTATFRRADNVHKILAYHFGLHLKMASRFPKPLIYAVKTNVKIRGVISKNKKHERFLEFMDAHGEPYTETKSAVEFVPDEPLRSLVEEEYKKGSLTKTAYHEITACIKRAADMAFPTVDSLLNEHAGRRKTAIRVIQDCLDMGRTVLFLSKRKDTLKALHKYFAKYKPVLIVSETNARTEEEERYLQKDCQLIFGVTQLAKEGLDIDRLDTLIIHLPIKDTEQAVGRISRLYEGKKFPVCLYLLDDCPMTYAVYRNAKKFFSINGEFKGEVTLKDLYKVL